MGRYDLASALTTDCHTGLCFYGHPDSTEYRVLLSTVVSSLFCVSVLYILRL